MMTCRHARELTMSKRPGGAGQGRRPDHSEGARKGHLFGSAELAGVTGVCVGVVVTTVRRGRVVSPLCRQGMTGRLERLSGLLIKGRCPQHEETFYLPDKGFRGVYGPLPYIDIWRPDPVRRYGWHTHAGLRVALDTGTSAYMLVFGDLKG